MTYTAHTKEIIPVLREKARMQPANRVHYDLSSDYMYAVKKFEAHIASLKSIPIHPDYVNHWQDGQEVDESEFEEVDDNYHRDGSLTDTLAIPKQKEETQEQLFMDVIKYIAGDNYSPVYIGLCLAELQSKFKITRL